MTASKPSKPKKPKKPTQGECLRTFGEEQPGMRAGNATGSYYVGESAQHPGEIQIGQYSSRLVGPLTPTQIRALAANMIAAADAIENVSEPPEDAQHEVSMCRICDGELTYLGMLGTSIHYRCRNCGMDFNTEGKCCNCKERWYAACDEAIEDGKDCPPMFSCESCTEMTVQTQTRAVHAASTLSQSALVEAAQNALELDDSEED